MKFVSLFSTLIFLSSGLWTQNESLKHTFLTETIAAMAEEYTQSNARNLVMQKVELLANHFLAKSTEKSAGMISQPVGDALLIYSFTQNVAGYQDTKSETQRHQAFAYATANAISYFFHRLVLQLNSPF